MNMLNMKSKQTIVNILAIAFETEFFDIHFSFSSQGGMELYLNLGKYRAMFTL